jgi:hypothetical protein
MHKYLLVQIYFFPLSGLCRRYWGMDYLARLIRGVRVALFCQPAGGGGF